LSIQLYQGNLANADTVFLLKYFISSQTAIMWMSALVFMATGAYWIGVGARSDFAVRMGSGLTWSAVTMGLAGLLVRWYESYLIGTDVGHIPIGMGCGRKTAVPSPSDKSDLPRAVASTRATTTSVSTEGPPCRYTRSRLAFATS